MQRTFALCPEAEVLSAEVEEEEKRGKQAVLCFGQCEGWNSGADRWGERWPCD